MRFVGWKLPCLERVLNSLIFVRIALSQIGTYWLLKSSGLHFFTSPYSRQRVDNDTGALRLGSC